VLLADQTLLDTTTILYTADHGQTLAEHGEAWTHGKDTPNEARVPLFLISKTSRQLDLAYKAHHTNIFPTLLDLIGYPKEKRLHSYALSLFEARASDSQPRPYYLGPLEGDGQLKRFVYEEELQKLSQSR
jgi:arylsulfatase A-like enzyme